MRNRFALFRLGALLLAAASIPALGDRASDYANTWFAEQLRLESFRYGYRDGAREVARERTSPWENAALLPQGGASNSPRSWDPNNESPWANAYGRPMSNAAWNVTTLRPKTTGPVRMCACFLPTDARSRDGGPLTEDDIARLCRAQCY
jgi:hypothetical protein